MSTGRSTPMLATCSGRGTDIDVVVKLNGAMDFGVRGAVFELTASMMASRMGIDCPRPFIVRFEPDFVNVVANQYPEKKPVLQRSLGLNFGTEMMKGIVIFGEAMKVTLASVSDALKIFVFDGLTQNPDRSAANPNLYVRGDKLTVIDHECAFSFLTAILKPSKAWTVGPSDFMERHTLKYSLRSGDVDWTECWNALRTLDASFFEEVRDSIPTEWNGAEDVNAIEAHVTAVVSHAAEFEEELRGKLR